MAAAAQQDRDDKAQALQAKADEERIAKETRDAEERRAIQLKKEHDENAAFIRAKDETHDLWNAWVEIQKRFKLNVIDVVKADRTEKTGLGAGMRLITRGVGQVVNTQASILKVVGHVVEEILSLTDILTDRASSQDLLRTAGCSAFRLQSGSNRF